MSQGTLKGCGGGQSLATALGWFVESCSQLQLSEGCLQHGAESRETARETRRAAQRIEGGHKSCFPRLRYSGLIKGEAWSNV